MSTQRLRTRQQRDLERALNHVSRLAEKYPDKKDRKALDLYGNLCHSFPILVRTNGLCQTLAFFNEKRRADKEQDQDKGMNHRRVAYNAFWAHVADVLGVTDETALLSHVQEAPVDRYLHDTRRVMEAWIYYKRFAVSILNVTAEKEIDG